MCGQRLKQTDAGPVPCPKARSSTPQHTGPARSTPGAEEVEFVDGRVADADEDGEGGGKGGDDIDDVKLTLKLNYSNFSNWNDRFPPQPFAQHFGVRKSNFLSAYRSLRYHSIPQYQSEFILDLKAHSRYRIGRFEGYHMRNYPLQLFYWYWGKIFQSYMHEGGGGFRCGICLSPF